MLPFLVHSLWCQLRPILAHAERIDMTEHVEVYSALYRCRGRVRTFSKACLLSNVNQLQLARGSYDTVCCEKATHPGWAPCA